MFVEVIDQLDERVPVLDQLRCVAEELVVVTVVGGLVGDAPDLEEAAVVREHLAGVVDDQDAVERRFLLRFQDADRGADGVTSAAPQTAGHAREIGASLQKTRRFHVRSRDFGVRCHATA